MKEIIKKIKKIIKEQDPNINVEDLTARVGNSVKPNGSGTRKPLVILLANITKWTTKNLIEEAQKHRPDVTPIGVRFKNFIDYVKNIKEPILSSEQETEDYWKKLYDDSKKYAKDYLWWREVFLGNIRS